MEALRFIALSSAAAAILGLVGCDDKMRPEPAPLQAETLLDQLNAEGLTEFVMLAEVAGLSESLSTRSSNLTVFAPTNAALQALPSDVRSDPDAISHILAFHIVGGRRASAVIGASDQLFTAAGSYMGVSKNGNTIMLLGAEGTEASITKADITANNGVLYVIDAVLTPTEPPGPGTVVDVATEAGLTTFATELVAARLDDDLSAEGAVYNVLAPNEMAFMDFGDLPADTDVLANILLNHVILGDIPTASIAEGAMLPTAAGTTITVPAIGASAGLPTNNGTLTEVTALVNVPTTAQVIADNADTSELAAALEAAPGAVQAAVDPDTLGGEPPITLFAPINAAFTASIAPGMLGEILQHHIVPMEVNTSSLTDGLSLTTLNGTLTVNVDGSGNVSITDGSGGTANVVGSEVRTLTGVIHYIDAVLMP